jgi:hypothetical protein
MLQELEIWSLQQAQEIIDMVQFPLANGTALLDLVQARVKVIEARGALRQANEARMPAAKRTTDSMPLPGR